LAKLPDTNTHTELNNDTFVFEAEVSKRLRWRGLRRFIWLRYRLVLLACLMLAFGTLLYAASLPSSTFSEVLGGIGGLSLILWFFFIHVLSRRERRDQRIYAGVPQRFHISRQRLEIESKFGVSVLHWYLVNKARRYTDMWLLLLGMQSYVIIPRAGMPDAVDELLAVMTSAGSLAGRCPKCGYALRGLVSQRCPECGTEVSSLARELASSPFDTALEFNPQLKPELSVTIASASPKTVIAIREYNLRQWIGVTLIILTGTGLLLLGNHVWLHMRALFFVGAGLFAWALISFSLYAAMQKVIRNYLRRAEKLDTDVMQIRVTAEGFQLSSGKGVDQRRWEAIKQVKKLHSALALTGVSGHSMVIPSADLSDEMLEAFLTRGASLYEPSDESS